MKIQDQTVISDKANGVYGNCWITTYACYLDLDVSKCPQIQFLFECEEPGYDFVDDVLDLWLSKYGYRREQYLKDPAEWGHADYYFAYGKSPRAHHQVIFKDGKLFHDPHPTKDGLVEITGYEILVKIEECRPEQNIDS